MTDKQLVLSVYPDAEVVLLYSWRLHMKKLILAVFVLSILSTVAQAQVTVSTSTIASPDGLRAGDTVTITCVYDNAGNPPICQEHWTKHYCDPKDPSKLCWSWNCDPKTPACKAEKRAEDKFIQTTRQAKANAACRKLLGLDEAVGVDKDFPYGKTCTK